MAKKLGEILMERGLLTEAQLEGALRNQLMLGGHLGTCLLELSLIDEDVLGETLAQVLRVPYAKPEVFEGIPEAVVRVVPKKVVEECRGVPFRLENRRLDVAMIDPKDLRSIDAFAFASGYHIVPWVSPEVRIFEAMEKIYDIPRRLRYITISRSLSPLEVAIARSAERAAPEPERPDDVPVHLGDVAPTTDLGLEFGYGRSWVEVAEELSAERTPDGRGADEREMLALAERLCDANDRDQLARAVLAHLATISERAMLFAVKGIEIHLWEASGPGVDVEIASTETFTVDTMSPLEHLSGQEHYCGPLGQDPRHRAVYDRLGMQPPRDILLVPVHINDRLVAIIHADGGPEGRLEADPEDALRLGWMLGLALNLVISKKKIRGAAARAAEKGRASREHVVREPRELVPRRSHGKA